MVDDDAQFIRYLCALLESHGYRAISATDGAEGLYSFLNDKPDVVVADLVIPGMAGLRLIDELRTARSCVPIIAISGFLGAHGKTRLRAAERLGADRAFAKPLDGDAMLAAIDELTREGPAAD